MKLKKALSQRIRALREAAGLSQQDVAMKGDLSLSLVAKLEQGKKADPRASTLLALAEALGVRPGQLLDDLFGPPPPAPAEASALEAGSANGREVSNGQEPEGDGKKARKKKEGKKKKKV
jgi:transcriptional regulator with XRE-family HTH domain